MPPQQQNQLGVVPHDDGCRLAGHADDVMLKPAASATSTSSSVRLTHSLSYRVRRPSFGPSGRVESFASPRFRLLALPVRDQL
jgi:hypothetical protein